MSDNAYDPLKQQGPAFSAFSPGVRPYQDARERMVQGDLVGAFDALHRLGFIQKISRDDFARVIAGNYLSAFENGLIAERHLSRYTAGVVCTFENDSRLVTQAIRTELKRHQYLRGDGVLCDGIRDMKLTNEQKARPSSYHAGLIAHVHQPSPGLEAGRSYIVQRAWLSGDVRLATGGSLPLNRPETFSIYSREEKSVELCVGDRVRHAPTLFNSDNATYRVTAIKEEHIILSDDTSDSPRIYRMSIPNTDRFATHAYCQTAASSPTNEVDCMFHFHSWTSDAPRVADQFRRCVKAAVRECFTYTEDVNELREAVVAIARQLASTHKQAERQVLERARYLNELHYEPDAQSIHLKDHSFNRGPEHGR